MSAPVSPTDLARWCAVPVGELVEHPDRRVPFRLCADPLEMGRLMASERKAAGGRAGRALVDGRGIARVARALMALTRAGRGVA